MFVCLIVSGWGGKPIIVKICVLILCCNSIFINCSGDLLTVNPVVVWVDMRTTLVQGKVITMLMLLFCWIDYHISPSLVAAISVSSSHHYDWVMMIYITRRSLKFGWSFKHSSSKTHFQKIVNNKKTKQLSILSVWLLYWRLRSL